MRDDRKLVLEFNSAITGLADGKWDEKAHNAAVQPLRHLIMDIDGVSGCFIARYGVEVNYLSRIVSKTRLTKAVRAAVREVANMDGFFPQREKKTPTVRLPKAAKRTHDTWWVAIVNFSTDLFVDEGKEDGSSTEKRLVAELRHADGVRHPSVWQRGMSVRFDRRQTTPESMEAHLKAVVASIMKDCERGNRKHFPFAEPTFNYQVGATNYLI